MSTIELRDAMPKVSRSAALRFSQFFDITGISSGGSLYKKLPQEPIKLSVLKLDGSSFNIEVTKTSTVAELKKAVQGAFSHMPDKGPGKISWPHVWGHFCLCYEDQKLVSDTEQINNYGIKDGDQLQFVRHQSIIYNLRRRRHKRRRAALKLRRIADGGEEMDGNGEEEGSREIQENPRNEIQENPRNEIQENRRNEILRRREKFKLSQLLSGWFSSKFATKQGKTGKSRITSGLLGSFRKIVRIQGKNCPSARVAWRENEQPR